MKIYKTRNVKTPERGTPGSAGIDFFVPYDFTGPHALLPGMDVNIPSGIRLQVPHGYALVFKNKSGVALKKGLQVGACVIDEDYQGEVHLHVRNISSDVAWIDAGEKLVQGLLVPILYEDIEVCDDIRDVFPEKSVRGTGGFGSTGTE